MTARRLGPLLLAVVVALGLVAAPPIAPPALAATPDLTIVGDARYEVLPDRQRVKVTVDLTLRNRLKDTATRRFYFDRAFLAVLPGTSAHKLTASGVNPSVSVARKNDDYTLLRLNLGRRLFSGKSAKYRLTFEMRDRGGSAVRDVRVGDALVTFPVWAFASDDTPGGKVAVIFPEGYSVDVEFGELTGPTIDDEGRSILRSGTLEKPLEFLAYVVADRPSTYEEDILSTRVGGVPVELTIRAWRDDPDWSERVSDLFERSLPVLGESIGLSWPRTDGLVVQEAVTRATGGYAGLFDPDSGHVEVAYFADDFVVLHEAAHAWFNGTLLVDRWASEAFASFYALEAAEALELELTGDELTEDLLEARIPLNAWGPLGRESTATEDYAYAATLELARLIAERATLDGLAEVWTAAAEGTGPYQPPAGGAEPERVPGPPDWRGLLDLLEEHTDASYDDLWRTWVARDEDLPLLAARDAARDRYEEVLEDADGWMLPRAIRDALRAWQFAAGETLLDEAADIFTERESLEAAASAAGLATPDTLREAFEQGDGFHEARAEIAAQYEAIERYETAVGTRPADPDPLTQLGLWDATPEADLEAAKAAFAAGDLEASAFASDTARATWLDAPSVGQNRAIVIALVTIAALLVLLLLAAAVVRWTRRRRLAGTIETSSEPVEPSV